MGTVLVGAGLVPLHGFGLYGAIAAEFCRSLEGAQAPFCSGENLLRVLKFSPQLRPTVSCAHGRSAKLEFVRGER